MKKKKSQEIDDFGGFQEKKSYNKEIKLKKATTSILKVLERAVELELQTSLQTSRNSYYMRGRGKGGHMKRNEKFLVAAVNSHYKYNYPEHEANAAAVRFACLHTRDDIAIETPRLCDTPAFYAEQRITL